ncbi:MAG: SUMF1/EgtB/PvdO family nonheme iron enzyme [Nostoc desertorum CM1-VF14]|nr:SUMF1/EgtB/PvdO family nonheme iron enzyme [Nostoc desertorum CM1-VF14]
MDNVSQYQVLRGGSWFHNPVLCRSAYRISGTRDYRNYFFGFRIVYAAGRTL